MIVVFLPFRFLVVPMALFTLDVNHRYIVVILLRFSSLHFSAYFLSFFAFMFASVFFFIMYLRVNAPISPAPEKLDES